MAKIPQAVLDKHPPLPHLPLLGRGKIRWQYGLPYYPEKTLFEATNGISVFDFVLPALIPQKGEVLNALSYFWTREALGWFCRTDLVATGIGIDQFLPPQLRGNPELQKRAAVVNLANPTKVEDVIRFYLTGSGWESYQATGTICGQRLPPGLKNGSKLPFPLYTPTSKAKEGHDMALLAEDVIKEYGYKRAELAIRAATLIANYAEEHDIVFADTKFEIDGQTLMDEKGTPDSSRYWDKKAWEKAMREGKLPPSLDKEFVRTWAKSMGVDNDITGRKREPTNPDDIAYVHSLTMPNEIVRMTTRLYRYIFWRLTGMKLEIYQREKMGIKEAKMPCLKIEVLIGSTRDKEQLEAGLNILENWANGRISVISCHRNLAELDDCIDELAKADVVIACAGKAAALPGIVKSKLCASDNHHIPVIGVALKGQTDKDSQAARLGIECLPDQPVELDVNGNAYFGPEGFTRACRAAITEEFLPKKFELKPAEIAFRRF